MVRVDNTDIRILDELRNNFHGAIYPNFRKDRPKAKPCWFWIVTGEKAISFLSQIYPYLISKREQADVVFAHHCQ